MIKGLHGLFYSTKPDELRAFIRDKLQLPFYDSGGGWLMFNFMEADLGVHDTDNPKHSGFHEISFFTDDLKSTVEELKGRGVEFDDEISEESYGFITHFKMPGGVKVQLYQPKYERK